MWQFNMILGQEKSVRKMLFATAISALKYIDSKNLFEFLSYLDKIY